MSKQRAIDLARAGREQAEADLFEELRIPSVSTDPAHRADVRRNAEWLAGRLERMGFEASLIDVVDGGHPVLRADWRGAGEAAPTLTVYGHYDVQPPDPLDEWESPPFEPVVRDGMVFARGSSDNKGNHMAAVVAAEHALAAGGPPVNLRFLIEGEEEISGASLPRYLAEHASELASDHTLVFDGGFAPDGRPALMTGLRGLLYTEIHARGAGFDLHSGTFGGVAPNPINTLALVIAGLKGADGVVTIPGFYDGIIPPTAAESADWDRSPAYAELARELMGARALEGDASQTPIDRQWALPTLDCNGIWGGFMGQGSKTVIPARAAAKVSMRLVPGQDPERILGLLKARVADLATPGVELEVRALNQAEPLLLGADHRLAEALRDAFGAAFGERPVAVRSGGSIPVAIEFVRHVGGEVAVSGLPQEGARPHSPNERYVLDHYHRGIEMLIELFWLLGRER